MADPLTIATGIVTFVGARNALASTIKKFCDLRKAPKDLEELENEISALQSHTEGISQLLEPHGDNRDEIIGKLSLESHIESARKKIQEVNRFLEKSLLDTSSSFRIRTSAWLKWQSEFSRLRQELRDVRLEIGTCINLFTAFVLFLSGWCCAWNRERRLTRSLMALYPSNGTRLWRWFMMV